MNRFCQTGVWHDAVTGRDTPAHLIILRQHKRSIDAESGSMPHSLDCALFSSAMHTTATRMIGSELMAAKRRHGTLSRAARSHQSQAAAAGSPAGVPSKATSESAGPGYL